VKIKQDESADAIEQKRLQEAQKERSTLVHRQANTMDQDSDEGAQQKEPLQQTPFTRQGQKVGRNDPCPCGSGKKYKQCHGKLN
jgi:preprotein translocase subunit SecA